MCLTRYAVVPAPALWFDRRNEVNDAVALPESLPGTRHKYLPKTIETHAVVWASYYRMSHVRLLWNTSDPQPNLYADVFCTEPKTFS